LIIQGIFKAFYEIKGLKGQAICFWLSGPYEPHRSYQKEIGSIIGKINVCDIEVPVFILTANGRLKRSFGPRLLFECN